MRAVVFSIVFAAVGLILCYGVFYIIGTIGGPFHQGEDDASRNIRIFLLASAGSIIAGGLTGFMLGRSRR
ncbi:hypothetical protein C7H09_08560 [Marinobacter fuscus]|uniref:Uncharacterized protein n=1 Tax=Marinobacter fuscus TaxID=2109942 RepID=A0A2T1KDL5_9GAMM|nr:hypothetical protein C7H09_08560 [Marinobacter fuscus]